MRKVFSSAIKLIHPRGIAAKTSLQFGCNTKILRTFTHSFSFLCSESYSNVGGHEDSRFLLPTQPIIDFSSRINEKDDAICLFHAMSKMRPQPSVVEFTKLLSVTASKEHYSEALWIFGEVLRLRGASMINENMMNIVIHCYGHEVDYGLAILGRFFKCGFKPNPNTFNNLIRGLFLNNKVDEVVKLFKNILILKLCKPSHVMIPTVIDELYKRGHNIGHLLALLEETSCYQVYGNCNAIGCLLKDGMVDDAIHLLAEVIVNGISPNISTIEGVYGFYPIFHKEPHHKKNLKKVALEVLAGAVGKEIQMMVIGKGKGMGVLELLMHNNCTECADLWKRCSVSDDSFVCDAVINGYCLLGHFDKAKEFFDSIVDMGHEPSIFSYGGLIIENCKRGNVDEAWQLFLQVCASKEYGLNEFDYTTFYRITYNTMLYGLFREGRFEDGQKLYKEMEGTERFEDFFTYDIFIYGLCKNQPIAEVFSFLKSQSFKPDIESYETVIDVLCNDGKPHLARDVLYQLPSKGIRPQRRTYNMIIGSLCREGFAEEAKSLFLEMVENGVTAEYEAYSIIERHDNMIVKFLEEMETDTKKLMKIDLVMINEHKEAGHLLAVLEETSYKVSDYCDAIACLCHHKMVDEALRLLYEVIVKGVFSPNIESVFHDVGSSILYKGVYHKRYLTRVAFVAFVQCCEKAKEFLDMRRDMGFLTEMLDCNCEDMRVKYYPRVPINYDVFPDGVFRFLVQSNSWISEDFVDDSFICDAVINGYCLLGHLDKAKDFFDSVVEMGHYKPSIWSYGGLIIENCRHGNVNEAWRLFQEVSSSSSLKHDITTYNSMLYGLFREGRFDDGWKVFEEMEAVDPDICRNLYTCNVLIYGLCRNRRIDEAISYLHRTDVSEFTNRRRQLISESYEIVIDELCKDGKPLVARDLFLDKLKSEDFEPRTEACYMILTSLCREGFKKEAKQLFKKLKYMDIFFWDRSSYSIVDVDEASLMYDKLD